MSALLLRNNAAFHLSLPTRPVPRRSLICRAEGEQSKPDIPPASSSSNNSPGSTGAPSANSGDSGMEWAPPVLSFFESDDISYESVKTKVTSSEIYQKSLKNALEAPLAKECKGFKKIPETVNGRLAMIGFLTGAMAEIFGAGSLYNQIAAAPNVVLTTMLLIIVGSIAPIAKGAKAEDIKNLNEQYMMPDGTFTELAEKANGRMAMIGFGGLLLVETVIGRALL